MKRVGRDTVVVITGASGGVGRATARLFGARQARVALLSRGRAGLEAAKREIEEQGGEALVIPTDVSDPAAIERATEAVVKQWGGIGVWINNAMVSMYSPFLQMTSEEFRHIVEVTFLGAVYGTHAALRRMMPRNEGVILQIGSALAFRSIPLQSAYCASKHAIQGFTESLRSELIHERSRVRVSIVNLPALNTTQFVWTKNKMGRRCRPVGTIYQPEVAAEAILFAAEHRRRELMVGFSTVQATVGEKFIPGLLDRKLAKDAWDGALLDQPVPADQPNNFWEPIDRDLGAEGDFTAQSRRHSSQLFLTENRAALAAAGLLAVGGALWSRRKPRKKAELMRTKTESKRLIGKEG